MKRLRLQAGSNLIEFALVLPLLLVLMFGIVDFSLALFDKAVITNAAREGARAGMVFGNSRMTDADIRTVVTRYCSTYLISFGSGLQSPVTIERRDAITNAIVLVADVKSGDILRVTVPYRYDYLVMSKLIPSLGTLNLRGTSVMRFE